jgi:hypothetical protein
MQNVLMLNLVVRIVAGRLLKVNSGYLSYKAVRDTRGVRSNSDKTIWKLESTVGFLSSFQQSKENIVMRNLP